MCIFKTPYLLVAGVCVFFMVCCRESNLSISERKSLLNSPKAIKHAANKRETSWSVERRRFLKEMADKKNRLKSEAKQADQDGKSTPPKLSVCERSKYMQIVLLEEAEKKDCAKVTSQDLAALTIFKLSGYDREDEVVLLKADDFKGMVNLKFLEIKKNNIKSFPADFFSEIPNLYLLDLSRNRFSTLPKGFFDRLTDLHFLFMNGGQITTLPKNLFRPLKKLEQLMLMYNELSEQEVKRLSKEVIGSGTGPVFQNYQGPGDRDRVDYDFLVY